MHDLVLCFSCLTVTLIFSSILNRQVVFQVGELVFVGLGLHDEDGISLRGLREVKNADSVFVELHTGLMRGFKIDKLGNMVQKKVSLVSRRMLEEESGAQILAVASKENTAFLVPGDPLIATTHVDLRIRAEKAGIKTRIVHGSSIISAVIGLTGLQNYKFGRSVSIPFVDVGAVSETPYNVVKANLKAGLHTLCFLDMKAEETRYMTVKAALETLLALERKKGEQTITGSTLAVGVARAGSKNSVVKADFVQDLLDFDFGEPPHSLVFPGKLHFMEVEALIQLASGPRKMRELIK